MTGSRVSQIRRSFWNVVLDLLHSHGVAGGEMGLQELGEHAVAEDE
jgi:hypothetical protein